MPDPLSIALGVVQVAETGFKLADAIYKYINSVRKSEEQFKDVADYVKLTCTVLEQIGSHLQDEDLTALYKPALLASAQDAIQGCEKAFDSLSVYLTSLTKDGRGNKATMSTTTKLGWNWKRKELDNHQVHLERYKSTFDLLLSALTFVSSSRTAKNTLAMKIELQRLMNTEAEAKKKEALLPSADLPEPLVLPRYSSLSETDSVMIISSPTERQSGISSGAVGPSAIGFTKNLAPAACQAPVNGPNVDLVKDSAAISTGFKNDETADEDALLARLNECASAVEKLSATLNNTILEWQQSRRYQRESLLPHFELLDSAIKRVSAFELLDTRTLPSDQHTGPLPRGAPWFPELTKTSKNSVQRSRFQHFRYEPTSPVASPPQSPRASGMTEPAMSEGNSEVSNGRSNTLSAIVDPLYAPRRGQTFYVDDGNAPLVGTKLDLADIESSQLYSRKQAKRVVGKPQGPSCSNSKYEKDPDDWFTDIGAVKKDKTERTKNAWLDDQDDSEAVREEPRNMDLGASPQATGIDVSDDWGPYPTIREKKKGKKRKADSIELLPLPSGEIAGNSLVLNFDDVNFDNAQTASKLDFDFGLHSAKEKDSIVYGFSGGWDAGWDSSNPWTSGSFQYTADDINFEDDGWYARFSETEKQDQKTSEKVSGTATIDIREKFPNEGTLVPEDDEETVARPLSLGSRSHSISDRSMSRSRSRPRSRSMSLTLLAGPAGVAAVGALVGYASSKERKWESVVIPSDSRRCTRSRRRAVSVDSINKRYQDPEYHNARIAQAGLASVATTGLVERVRSKSREGTKRSVNRLQQGIPITSAGLGGAALAGLYENNRAGREAQRGAIIGGLSARQRSRTRSDNGRDDAGDTYDAGYIPTNSSIRRSHSDNELNHYQRRDSSASASRSRDSRGSRPRSRSYSRSRSRSRSRSCSADRGSSGAVGKNFDTSLQGIGVGLAVKVVGGMAGRHFGERNSRNKNRDVLIGALVGGLGANATEMHEHVTLDEFQSSLPAHEEQSGTTLRSASRVSESSDLKESTDLRPISPRKTLLDRDETTRDKPAKRRNRHAEVDDFDTPSENRANPSEEQDDEAGGMNEAYVDRAPSPPPFVTSADTDRDADVDADAPTRKELREVMSRRGRAQSSKYKSADIVEDSSDEDDMGELDVTTQAELERSIRAISQRREYFPEKPSTHEASTGLWLLDESNISCLSGGARQISVRRESSPEKHMFRPARPTVPIGPTFDTREDVGGQILTSPLQTTVTEHPPASASVTVPQHHSDVRIAGDAPPEVDHVIEAFNTQTNDGPLAQMALGQSNGVEPVASAMIPSEDTNNLGAESVKTDFGRPFSGLSAGVGSPPVYGGLSAEAPDLRDVDELLRMWTLIDV